MPYELAVTEVGPAEYPLIEVLRETIFSEVGHRSLTSFAELLEGRKDVHTLLAHLAGIRQDVTAGRILVILDRSKPA